MQEVTRPHSQNIFSSPVFFLLREGERQHPQHFPKKKKKKRPVVIFPDQTAVTQRYLQCFDLTKLVICLF